MISRMAVASDSGLKILEDIKTKVLYLPLTSEGVFGEALKKKLENSKNDGIN